MSTGVWKLQNVALAPIVGLISRSRTLVRYAKKAPLQTC